MAQLDLHMRAEKGKVKVATIRGYSSPDLPKTGGWLDVEIDGVRLALHFDHPRQLLALAGAMTTTGEAFRREVEGEDKPEPACNGKTNKLPDECRVPLCDTPPAGYHGQEVKGHRPREEPTQPSGEMSPSEQWEVENIEDTAACLHRAAQDIAQAAGNLNVAANNVSKAANAVHGLARVL